MNKWQKIMREEAEMLSAYYNYKNKIQTIILSVTQIIALFFSLPLIRYLIQGTDRVYFIVMLIMLFAIFVLLPQKLKKCIRRQVISLDKNCAVLYRTYVIDKCQKTEKVSDDGGGVLTKYQVKVMIQIETEKRIQKIETDQESFGNIKIGGVCNIVFFALTQNETPNIKYMEAFDEDFTVAREIVNIKKL